jgi:hypothetical protein
VHYIIIGTDHRCQKTDSQYTGLRDLLQCILIAHPNVALIAEEVETRVQVSTFGLKLIGNDKWLSIDMDAKTREEVRLDAIPCETGPGDDNDSRVNRYHTQREAVRETFWLDKIARWCEDRAVSTGTVVITCGHIHMRAGFLADRVHQRGHTARMCEYLPFNIDAELGEFKICP